MRHIQSAAFRIFMIACHFSVNNCFSFKSFLLLKITFYLQTVFLHICNQFQN